MWSLVASKEFEVQSTLWKLSFAPNTLTFQGFLQFLVALEDSPDKTLFGWTVQQQEAKRRSRSCALTALPYCQCKHGAEASARSS